MMRMKGHAIHDAAQYVPRRLFEFWQARDPIARFERYLVEQKHWLSAEENRQLIAQVERDLDAERAAAEASPMPDPETDKQHPGVYCEPGCHEVRPKYDSVVSQLHDPATLSGPALAGAAAAPSAGSVGEAGATAEHDAGQSGAKTALPLK
jgi:hypothetical protein